MRLVAEGKRRNNAATYNPKAVNDVQSIITLTQHQPYECILARYNDSLKFQ